MYIFKLTLDTLMAVWNLHLLLNKSHIVFSICSAQLWNHKIKKPEKAFEIRWHYLSLHIWSTQLMAHGANSQRGGMTFPRSQHSDFAGNLGPLVWLSWLLPNPLTYVPIKAEKGTVIAHIHPGQTPEGEEGPSFFMVCGRVSPKAEVSILSFSEEPKGWQICWFVQSSSALTCAKCGAFICPICFDCCFPWIHFSELWEC